jgi:nucleoside-diphosphate-sugar epimerase
VPTSLRQRRILITGASGFIGAQLAARLAGEGAEVVALVRPGANDWRLRSLAPDVPRIAVDITAADCAARIGSVGEVDALVHLAAAGVDASAADTADVVRVNVEGSARVMIAAARAGVKRFLYCGSCFEYASGSAWREDAAPQPQTLYGASKSAGWTVTKALGSELGVPTAALRPFTAYGPFEAHYRLVPRLVEGALRGVAVPLTSGKQTRDWVYIEDVVDAFATALSAEGIEGAIFNVCTGTESSVRTVAELVLELARSASTPDFGALPYRAHEFWRLSGDPTRAAEHLGWRARTPLRVGLARTIAWFREHSDALATYRRCTPR